MQRPQTINIRSHMIVTASRASNSLTNRHKHRPTLGQLARRRTLQIRPPTFVRRTTRSTTLNIVIHGHIFIVGNQRRTLMNGRRRHRTQDLMSPPTLNLSSTILSLIDRTRTITPTSHINLISRISHYDRLHAVSNRQSPLSRASNSILHNSQRQFVPRPRARS